MDFTDYTDISGDGGVMKKILEEGTGECPEDGMAIVAHYTGTLDDGTQFDSSHSRNTPFKFKVGKGSVIKGWDIGFMTMKVILDLFHLHSGRSNFHLTPHRSTEPPFHDIDWRESHVAMCTGVRIRAWRTGEDST